MFTRIFKKSGRVLQDLWRPKKSSVEMSAGIQHQDSYVTRKGEIFYKMHDEETGELLEEGHIQNIITLDFSILLARLIKDSLDPSHGILALAVGTGDAGWDLQNPPASTNTQRSLYAEISRKGFSQTSFIDSSGNESVIPTNIVQFTTFFTSSEAVGPLVEMGLVGGDISDDLSTLDPITPANGTYDATVDVQSKDLLCNYLTFPVINKPSSATFTLSWRITL
jgi:hypothetical protein